MVDGSHVVFAEKVDGLLQKRNERQKLAFPPRLQTKFGGVLIEICQRLEDMRHRLATSAGPQRALERSRGNL